MPIRKTIKTQGDIFNDDIIHYKRGVENGETLGKQKKRKTNIKKRLNLPQTEYFALLMTF